MYVFGRKFKKNGGKKKLTTTIFFLKFKFETITTMTPIFK